MSVVVGWRFLWSKALVACAAWLSRVLRPFAYVRAVPGGPASRPSHEDRAARMREIQQSQQVYALGEMTTRFRLDPGIPHRTAAALPPWEEYAWPMNVSKALLAAGLSVELHVPADATWRRAEDLDALFSPLATPRAAGLSLSDEHFARLRLQGPNPVWLHRADVMGGRPLEGLSAESLRAFRVDALPRERLFTVNYDALLSGITPREGRYLAPCIAVFHADDAGVLHTVGIQLRDADGERLTRVPDGSTAWELAKLFFHNADIFVHEAVSHFLWTHVYGEKILLATHRQLAQSHPLWCFLAPHFLGTLRANQNSGSRLLGRGGIFDRCFSAGWEGTAELIRRGDALWRFENMVLPRQLRARGVESLANHPYAEDGMALWNAIHAYAEAYFSAWYGDDLVVAQDPELQAWVAELRQECGGGGFPDITTRTALVEAASAALFNVVQHTLVNALQYEMFGNQALFPATLRVPVAHEPVDAQALVRALPTVEQTLDAIRATYGFSVQYNVLGRDLERFHAGPAQEAARAFAARLVEIQREIVVRDQHRPHPYRIAAPLQVSNSINA